MNRFAQKVVSGGLAAGLSVAVAVSASAQEARSGAWTLNAPEGEWHMTGRDYSLQRFSPLKQITTSNVAELRPVWSFSTGTLAGPRGQPARHRQRDVRPHVLPEHRVRARSVQGRRAADLEVRAQPVARRDSNRLLRPGEPRAPRITPAARSSSSCSRVSCSRSMPRPAKSCGRSRTPTTSRAPP